MARLSFTHVLTAELVPIPMTVTSRFPHVALMHVPIPDMPDADLLTKWFKPAVNFIEEGLNQGGIVLVQCYHGVSRSATLIAAYLLKAGLNSKVTECHSYNDVCTIEEVMAFLQSRRPTVCPNDGFMAQLKMWSAMGCRLEPSFKPYKMYQLDCVYNQLKQTKILPSNIKSFFQACPPIASFGLSLDNKVQHDDKSAKFFQESLRDLRVDSSATNSLECCSATANTITTVSEAVGKTSASNKIISAKNTDHLCSCISKEPFGLRSDDGYVSAVYRCRKCRSILATADNIIPHGNIHSNHKNGTRILTWQMKLNEYLQGQQNNEYLQDDAIQFHEENAGQRNNIDECKQGIFVEPMKWMGCRILATVAANDASSWDKLNCGKCNAKVGTFAWQRAISCACGLAIAPPGFLINASRVDRCTMLKDVEASI